MLRGTKTRANGDEGNEFFRSSCDFLFLVEWFFYFISGDDTMKVVEKFKSKYS